MAWISELEESKEEARAEGWEEGRQEGRQEGSVQGREQTAIRMLKDNMPISKIILYSSLSESRILELQQNLNNDPTVLADQIPR